MSEPTEDIALHIVEGMGEGAALVVAMRLVLLVGQRHSDADGILEAVQEAIAAIKRAGAAAGAIELG